MRSSADALLAPPSTGLTHFVLWPLPDLRDVPAASLELDQPPAAEPDAGERAHSRGIEEGRRQGRAESERELRAAREAVAALSRALHQAHTAWSDALEANLHALAVAVAHQVIEREVELAPEIVRDLVHHAAELAGGPHPVVVRVHPDDVAALAALPPLEPPGADGEPPALTLQPDPAVGRGGCIAETPSRLVDGRVETALLALYQRLRNG